MISDGTGAGLAPTRPLSKIHINGMSLPQCAARIRIRWLWPRMMNLHDHFTERVDEVLMLNLGLNFQSGLI